MSPKREYLLTTTRESVSLGNGRAGARFTCYRWYYILVRITTFFVAHNGSCPVMLPFLSFLLTTGDRRDDRLPIDRRTSNSRPLSYFLSLFWQLHNQACTSIKQLFAFSSAMRSIILLRAIGERSCFSIGSRTRDASCRTLRTTAFLSGSSLLGGSGPQGPVMFSNDQERTNINGGDQSYSNISTAPAVTPEDGAISQAPPSLLIKLDCKLLSGEEDDDGT
jgi:hypothetical protein